MRELSHDNINPFIGASIDAPNTCFLMAYCPKGSLEVGEYTVPEMVSGLTSFFYWGGGTFRKPYTWVLSQHYLEIYLTHGCVSHYMVRLLDGLDCNICVVLYV